MRLRDLLGGGPVKLPPDGFPLKPGSPNATAHTLLSDLLTEAGATPPWDHRAGDFANGLVILGAEPQVQVLVVDAAIERLAHIYSLPLSKREYWPHYVLDLLPPLLARRLPFQRDGICRLLDFAYESNRAHSFWRSIAGTVERYVAANGLDAELRARLERWARKYEGIGADGRKAAERIRAILGETPPILAKGEAWADSVLAELSAMPPEQRDATTTFLAHVGNASGSKPSGAWLKAARSLLDATGEERPSERLSGWLRGFARSRPDAVNDKNADVLRGMVWCCRLADDPGMSAVVADVAEAAFRKIPNVGAVCAKVGNACVNTLGAMGGMEPVMQLERLRRRVKMRVGLKLIEDAFQAAAERAGLTPEELAELAAPTYGMEEVGRLREEVGGFTAEILLGTGKPAWQWSTREGKPLKAVPSAVKNDHPAEWKAMKTLADEMGKMLPVQRERLEWLFLAERQWDFRTWRARYLDHPLVGHFARRLIWHFSGPERSPLAIWQDGALRDVEGAPLEVSPETTVRLWHPIGSPPETVLRWRTFLEERRITQPFKQAHREVYILTDAEVETVSYSNRFASHILKQHQFSALCRQRGWRYALQGAFDSPDETATLSLPRWGLSAEFWTDRPWGDVDREGSMSEMGIFLHVVTDQVRFLGPDREPRPLVEVPALVFSEVMRDVDLFVGVSSVGNDPMWRDRGDIPADEYAYWNNYSFGDLSASAETRRDVLGRLIPRLKITSRCRLEGKFLVVRGDVRTYKIHLGSANILMEPNDQYLCIVPDRKPSSGEGHLFLPFEGDQTLSLILSKAFLLAEDRKITDPTILRQIRT